MTLQTANFLGAIHEIATEIGAEPTEKQAEIIELVTQSLAYIDPEAGVVMIDTGGEPIGVREFVASELRKIPAPVKEPQGPAPTPPSKFLTNSPREQGIAAIGRGWTDLENKKVWQETQSWPNPWKAGPNYNRTRQSVLTNIDPQRADKLRAEATSP